MVQQSPGPSVETTFDQSERMPPKQQQIEKKPPVLYKLFSFILIPEI